MGLRAPYSVDAMKLANERVDKIMARIYLLWLIGVGVGLIKLKADKATFNGIQYSIGNPEVIQGLIFVAVIFCYVAIVGLAFLFSVQYSSLGNRAFLRRMIHLACGTTKTLQRLAAQIRVIKTVARQIFGLVRPIVAIMFLFPILHIALFERPALELAFKAIFYG
ncbi:hypothetical protein [Bradyrhizobium sp. USDA 241]|uniref:hypothetical protein n=1 Tax=Bradyrhizobium sp. USDA 241 TaxID=3377725 RepID=UPI003C76FA08